MVCHPIIRRKDSSVGIVTRYGVRGTSAIDGEVFLTRPKRPWGQPILLYNGVPGLFPGGKAAGVWC